MTTIRAGVAPAVALAAALAACAAPGGTPASGSADPGASRPAFETAPPSAGVDVAEGPAGLPPAAWTAILEDLERRLDRPIVDPTVVRAVATTWNDGSLGCPVAGQMYTQALVDGFHVILEADGEQFDYRVGGTSDVRLCEE